MGYVDGFLLPVPKKNLRAYAGWHRRRAKFGASTARLNSRNAPGTTSRSNRLRRGVSAPGQAQAGETVMFSFIVYKSRAHRDRVIAKVMKDPRLAKMMDPKSTPFDVKRMAYGGFKVLVDE